MSEQAQTAPHHEPLSKRARWTFTTAFTGNAVYFSIIPFLTLYLADVLHLPQAVIGTVLAMRAFASQAFTLPGSIVGRFLGTRTTLALSSLLRAVAYFLFAMGRGQGYLVAAVLVIGVASSITTGLSSALVSGKERGRNVLAFANLATFRNAGEIVGFLVGGWLCPQFFGPLCLAAGVIYLITTLAFLLLFSSEDFLLDAKRTVAPGVRGVALTGVRFLGTCLGVAPYSILVSQLYVVVPLFVLSSENRADFLGVGLAIAALVGVVSQALVSIYLPSLYTNRGATTVGHVLMGVSFLLLPLCAATGLSDWVGSILCGSVLTLGTVFAYPSAMAHIRACTNGRDTGMYFGIYYTLAAILTAGVTKWLVGVGLHGPRSWMVYASLTGVAVVGAVAEWVLSDTTTPVAKPSAAVGAEVRS